MDVNGGNGLSTAKIIAVMFLGIFVGITLGLFVAWVVWPVEYYEGPPALLKDTWKDEILYLVSVAYAQDGDLEAARARVRDLAVTELDARFTRLAHRLEAEGAPPKSLEALALLAKALGLSNPELSGYIPSPPPPPTFTPVAPATTAALTHLPPAEATTPESGALPGPTPTHTPQARNSFVLKAREKRCHSEDRQPVLGIEVLDEEGKPLSGVAVVISWEDGEERIFTGLKPGKSPGYADFVMSEGYTYLVRVDAPDSEEAGELAARTGECPEDKPLSSWHLVFREISSR